MNKIKFRDVKQLVQVYTSKFNEASMETLGIMNIKPSPLNISTISLKMKRHS